MSARRWFVLLGFALVSLVLSLGWFVWVVFTAQPGQRTSAMGITGLFQLIELPLAYGLLRLTEYAHTWTVRLNLTKIVTAAALTIGFVGAGIRDPEVIAFAVAVCAFYGTYTLFLRRNAQFFD